MQAAPQLPELQQHVVAEVVAALQADPSCMKPIRNMFLMPPKRGPRPPPDTRMTCLQLAESLQRFPALHEQLCAAVSDVVCAASGEARAALQAGMLEALAPFPQLQQRLVTSLAASMRAEPKYTGACDLADLVQAVEEQPVELRTCLAAAAVAVVKAEGAVRHSSDCIQLMEALGWAPELQQELLEALAGDVRAGGTKQQAEELVELVSKLKGLPLLQEQLAEAVAEALVGNPVAFASQTVKGLCQLSDLLLGRPALRSKHYSQFAAACLQRPAQYHLLCTLLATAQVRGALQVPGVQQLVAAQVALLGKLTLQPGQQEEGWEWRMVDAALPGYPEVRGPMPRNGCYACPAPVVAPGTELSHWHDSMWWPPAQVQLVHLTVRVLRCRPTYTAPVINQQPISACRSRPHLLPTPTSNLHTRLADFTPYLTSPPTPHPPPTLLQVESFLRGPQLKATFSFFKDMHHAQAWAAKYFDHGRSRKTSHRQTSSSRGYAVVAANSRSPMFCCYSAAVELGKGGGEGGSVCVKLVKSKDWLQERRQQRSSLLGKLAQVQGMVRRVE